MNGKILTAIGIAMTTIGTVFTLWTILLTDPKVIGTYGEPMKRREEFPKEQGRAKIGYYLVTIGGLLQIIGLFV